MVGNCGDCIHFEVCSVWNKKFIALRIKRQSVCEHFKNKADFVGGSDYQPYGYVRFVPDEVLEDEVFSDELEGTKLFVLEKIIEFMRREAAENPDFFIINREVCGDPLSRNSVGLKVYLPKRRYGEWEKSFLYSRGYEDHYRITCPYCRYSKEVTCVGDNGMEDERYCPRCGVRLGGG